jgi:hypothetical protein
MGSQSALPPQYQIFRSSSLCGFFMPNRRLQAITISPARPEVSL